jgi:pimeloyl-ACP methyl ester carboxylesterase
MPLKATSTAGDPTEEVPDLPSAARVFERDGIGIRYRVEGTGPDVLLVHSATSTGTHEWGALVAQLSASFRCVTPDLRSHGDSDHRDGALGLDDVVEDLAFLIDHAGLDHPAVIAFSFGAEVALEFEIRCPGAAGALVLVSPGTGHPRGVPQPEQTAPTWPRSLRQLHERKHGPDHWRTILETLSHDAAGRDQIPDEVLAAIRCPILLVVGSEDQRRRVRQAQHFAEINPRARLEIFDGVGHAAHAAEPQRFAVLVRQFLLSAFGHDDASDEGDRSEFRPKEGEG